MLFWYQGSDRQSIRDVFKYTPGVHCQYCFLFALECPALCGRYGTEKVTIFLLLSTHWSPNNYRRDYGGYAPYSPRGWGIGHQRTTPKLVADIVFDPVRYHPEFPSQQSEGKEPGLQHVHLFQHKCTSIVAENLDFTNPSECVKNVISCNSHHSCSGEEARWKNPA